jgi:hypothetical protein
LWVNGEKYVFSREVLDAGAGLFNSFCKVQHFFRDIYHRVCEESNPGTVDSIRDEIRQALEAFDTNWSSFERLYVNELMLIEADARQFITDAIEIEKELMLIEVKEKAKGRTVLDCEIYNKHRGRMVEQIGKINSVANIEGKGREDLKVDILFAAEGITRRISSCRSRAVKQLAE